MSLTLEIPSALQSRLQVLANSRGQDVSQLLLEAASRTVYSLEDASRQLHLASSSLRERAARGELESLVVEGELFFVRDARFDALEQLQNQRFEGLQEVVRLTEEMGLYEHQK